MNGLTNSSQPVGPTGAVLALIFALRPRQWIKNLLVFFALFFSVNEAWTVSDVDTAIILALRATAAFVIFVALSGSVYLINDSADAERDRQHPQKRHRPIASGVLPVWLAMASASVLAIAGLGAAFMLDPLLGAVGLVYIAIQNAYTLRLKSVAVLDVFCVASGFVLRVTAGAAVIGVPVSPWLYICSGLGALFIALSKRRSELVTAGDAAPLQRDALSMYTVRMLDQMISVVGTSALVAYALYTFTAENLPDNHAMMLTLPFVVYGLFRYIFLVHSRDAGEAPERMLTSDLPLVATIILWLIASLAILLTTSR